MRENTSLEQWFLNFIMHENHLVDVLKYRLLGPTFEMISGGVGLRPEY